MRKGHIITDDQGEPVELPSKWAICHACSGHGASSAYLGAYTRDEMDQQGPDFLEDYMAGVYDRTCDDCDGSGKVQVPDFARMTAEQKRLLEEHERFEDEFAAEAEAERRMGC